MPTLKSHLEACESGRRAGSKVTCRPSRWRLRAHGHLRSHQTMATGRGSGPTAGSAPENRLQRPARANSIQRGRRRPGQQQAPPCRRQSSPRGVRGHLPLCWDGSILQGSRCERLRGPETTGQPRPPRGRPAPRRWLQSGRAQSCQRGRGPRSWGGCTSRSGRCPAGS